jgi:hypothetical protein
MPKSARFVAADPWNATRGIIRRGGGRCRANCKKQRPNFKKMKPFLQGHVASILATHPVRF